MERVREVKLGEVMHHRKAFVHIDDQESYKRCRVQLHARGIALRDTVKGSEIRTKQQQVCQLNDFIVAEMDAKFGGYGVIRNGLENAIVSSHYFLFEPDADKLSIDYLELLCQTDVIQSQIKATGSTNYAAIRPYHILEIQIPLPDLPTQKAIVARLQSLQSLHREADATLARLKADVKRLRQSILQEAIQGKLVDYKPAPGEKTGAELLADIRAEKERRAREAGKKPEAPLPPVTPEEMPFELPEGWVWCRLGEVADVIDPNPSHRMPEYVLKGVPFISTDNFNIDKTIDFERGKKVAEITLQEHIERYEILDTSFAFSRIGTIGKTVKLPTSRNYCLSHSLCIITPTPQSINSDYLQFVMSSEFVLLQATKGVRSISVPDLGMARIRQFVIPLPRIMEQSKIVDVVNAQLSQLTLLDQQLATLQTKTERLWKSELQQTFKFESNG